MRLPQLSGQAAPRCLHISLRTCGYPPWASVSGAVRGKSNRINEWLGTFAEVTRAKCTGQFPTRGRLSADGKQRCHRRHQHLP